MSGTVWLLCDDLMVMSTVSGAAQAAGWTVETVSDVSHLAGKAAADGLLVVDLARPGLNLAELSAAAGPELCAAGVAFGPHVQTERFEEARQCGFRRTWPRGRFVSGVAALFAEG